MNFTVTTKAQSRSIMDAKPAHFVPEKGYNVMSMKLSSDLTARYTGEIIPRQNF